MRRLARSLALPQHSIKRFKTAPEKEFFCGAGRNLIIIIIRGEITQIIDSIIEMKRQD
jgi:hypothetical protein